jgi:hypothetical protein
VTDPQPLTGDERKGRPQGGMKSEEGRAAYWRMQWESAIGALADLIAEHTEAVEGLRDALAKAEQIEPSGSPEWVESGVAMRTTVIHEIRRATS